MTTTVWVVMINDRHAEPEIKVFASQANATAWMWTEIRKFAYHANNLQESNIPGYDSYVRFSPEDNYAWVKGVEVEEAIILRPTPQQVWTCPMQPNDAGASTVGEYLLLLAANVWREAEYFSGKRPFGNSGWQGEVERSLIKAGLVAGTLDNWGAVDEVDTALINDLIVEALYFQAREITT